MLKQIVITGIAAASLMLSVQASAHQNNNNARVNHGHSGHHHQPVRKPAKFNINKEQREQANMIKQGIKTCQITPQEANRLNTQQHNIKKAERRMRKDGIQNWERNKLKQRLHNARVNINRMTKNAKNCRPSRGNHSHGHRGNAHRSNNKHITGTWDLTSGRGTIGIAIIR